MESRVKVLAFEEIKAMCQSLSNAEIERLISEMTKKLPVEARARVVQDQLEQSGLVVVMSGSNCSVNTEVCIQIQNAPNVDVGAIIEAAVQRHKRDRKSGVY